MSQKYSEKTADKNKIIQNFNEREGTQQITQKKNK